MEENAENCSLLFFFLTFSSIIFFLPLSFHIQIRSWRYHRGIVIPGKYTDSSFRPLRGMRKLEVGDEFIGQEDGKTGDG